MTDYTDSELFDLFRDPDKKSHAFDLIINKYQERIYWHIRKLLINHDDTNDVVQNTFIKAWKGLEDFRGQAGIFTWLYRIATNESLTFLRQKNRTQSFFPFSDKGNEFPDLLEADPYFDGNELQKKLQKAILKLPPKQRLVFNMKYFDEMKYEEISEILGTSIGSLKASFHHAVNKIEKYLED
ncbi:MAG: RNA polymerase sigma factor [Bacteroidia bacterium]|nr:RNA polymerase sigma factor [Bacteroidia bacterium]